MTDTSARKKGVGVVPLRPQPAALRLTEAAAAVGICMLAVQASLAETGEEAIPDFCVGFDFELVDNDGKGTLRAVIAIDPHKLQKA